MEILDETRRYPRAARLEGALEALMRELGLGEREVTVVLTGDREIRALNRSHRGVDEPTDVLSYPAHEPDDVGMPEVPHLGDIVISLDTAGRQADEHGHALADEVAVLAAHGLTHLQGYDHPTEDAWQVFETAQRRVLELLAQA